MAAAIEIQQLSKRYGVLSALDNIDLSISPGEFFALLGPNGAGKTTLISILAGLTLPTRGCARIMGYDVVTDYTHSRKKLGVVPQEIVFDPFFTVREALVIQSGYFGIRKNEAWIDEILHRLDLTDKAETNMRALSGGMKRRVMVAQALVHKPPVIILDEPTAGVDVELRQALWIFIKQLNKDGHTVVLTTHYLEEAEALCNRVAMLKKGQIVVLDNIRNLITSVQGFSVQLRLSTEILPTALQEWPRNSHEGLHIFKIKDYYQVETLLAVLRMENIQVMEMQLQQPDLEEVFVKIMGAK